MAIKTYLTGNSTLTVSDNDTQVIGESGANTQAIKIASGVTGVSTDSNIDKFNLSGNLSAYKFVASTAGTQIQDAAGNVILTIPSLNGTTAAQGQAPVFFADGSTPLVQTGGSTFTLGGQTVPTTAAPITSGSMGSSFTATNTLTLSGASTVNEGASAVYTVSLGSASSSVVTVPYTLTGTTTAGVDFTGASATLTIPANTTTATITLPVTADSLTEGAETIIVTLGTPSSGYTVVSGQGTVTTSVADTSLTPPSIVGTSFALTTAYNIFTGTAADDTYIGGVVDIATGTNSTLTSSDELDGLGGNDRLSITVQGATQAPDITSGSVIRNIETINIRDVASNASANTFNAGLAAGVTAVNSDRSTVHTGGLVILGLASGASAGMIGNTVTANGDVTFGYKAATSSVPGATAATFNVTGGTTAGAVNLALDVGTLVNSLTINSTGENNTIAALNLASAGTAGVNTLTINAATNFTTTGITNFLAGTTATITASGAATTVSIGTLPATVLSVNGSGLTAGGITTTLVTGNASGFTFVGGQGKDTVTTAAITNTTAGSVNAGAGTTDTLVIAAAAQVDTAAEANVYTGFEVLQLGAITIADASLISGITALRMSGSSSISSVNATSAANVTITADSTPTIAPTGATTPGQIDTVGITVTNGTANTATTITTPVLTSVENLTLTATNGTGLVTVTALTSAASLTNMTVRGASNVTVTTGAVAEPANLGFTFDSSASTATTITFDASAATANGVKFIGGVSSDVVTGTTLVDNIAAGAGNNSIKALAGNDIITVTAGLNTISGGVGADSITLGTGADVVTLRGDSSTISNTSATAAVHTSGTMTVASTSTVATLSVTINDIVVTSAAFDSTAVTTDTNQLALLRTAIANNVDAAQYVTASGTSTLVLTATTAGVTFVASDVSAGGASVAGGTSAAGSFTTANVRGTGTTTVDTITGFDFGSAVAGGVVDKFLIEDGSSTAISIYTGTDTAIAGTGALTTALNTAITSLGLNQAGIFTYDGSTYLVIDRIANSTTFGETTALDVAVKLVGYTGTLDASDFIFA